MNTKDVIEYMIALVNEFAKECGLTDREAFRYMKRFGAIDFFIEHYNVAHTQSFADMVDVAKEFCRKNGGEIA